MTTDLARPAALSEQVVRLMEDRIRGGDMRPGDRLPTERKLCAEFSVNRAVVREAIARLRTDGCIETRQGAGAFGAARRGRLGFRLGAEAAAGREDLQHVMGLRMTVEGAAAELAARRRRPADLAARRAVSHPPSRSRSSRSPGDPAGGRRESCRRPAEPAHPEEARDGRRRRIARP